MAKKTLYQSELISYDWVEITIKGPLTKSKYPGKPPYVPILLDGVERFYDVENEACENAFKGRKIGERYVIRATGGREEARIEFEADGTAPIESPEEVQRQPTGTRPNPADRSHLERRGGQGSQAPAREASQPKGKTERPAKQSAPAAKPAPGNHAPVFGATVGMAVKEAVGIVREIGIQPLTPDFYRMVNEIASDIIRIALSLESGHLVPKLSDRIAAKEAQK